MKRSRLISITPKFSKRTIQIFIDQQLKLFEGQVLERLKRVGESFITRARDNNTYKDITGNLRSSIGYIIIKDGEQLFESFPGDKSEGKVAGKLFAKKVAQDHPDGFILIAVAGMDYAAAVESRGKDVITGSSMQAKEDLKKSLKELQKKFSKK